MTVQYCSAAHLDYLQRTGTVSVDDLASPHRTCAPSSLRRLWRIKGMGLLQKQFQPQREMKEHLPSEGALIGLYGNNIPLAFTISGRRDEVAIQVGTWLSTNHNGGIAKANGEEGRILDERQEMLRVALCGSYSALNLEKCSGELPSLPCSGFVLGIPVGKPPDSQDGSLPLDRLIRALNGANWGCLVLAEPVDESVTSVLRENLIKELRVVQASRDAERGPSPVVDHYSELLGRVLKTLTAGMAMGMWRTGVYLLGDAQSYYRIASVWRGVFSDEESLPEPVRIWDSPVAGDLASQWAMPDVEADLGPGHYRHLLRYQTLLTSKQLAAYIHLPGSETSGFTIDLVPKFDTVPPRTESQKCVTLGQVLQRGSATDTPYKVSLRDLSSHTFVAGVTGSGKTTTIKHLLKEANAGGVPFMVIEPAKAEYRSLLNDPELSNDLQIFTLGNELVSPFRLNPFEVIGWPATSISVHIDLLRSAFSASFGMWTPLPQVLEQCLHCIYEDRGWNVTTNENVRLNGLADVAIAFPTLSDLAAKVEVVTSQLGYEEKVTADIRAALLTRINGLRAGGKGRMLDVQRSLPMEALLGQPTVLELEGMGDDDDKAFLMGLLITRLVEYRRATASALNLNDRSRELAESETDELKHLLVVEEAHRLLANVGPRRSSEEGDPRGKAVETFANLLSEIRVYGQGVIVADQIPVKLTPDVIKNTNLKIVHRIVARDDREVLAGAMAMDEQQMHSLAILTRGQAAVFSQGDDAPILVKIPGPTRKLGLPDDSAVAERFKASKSFGGYQSLFEPLAGLVDLRSKGAILARDAARAFVEDLNFQRDFVRLIISSVENDEALNRLWDGVLDRARGLNQHLDRAIFERCLLIYAAQSFAARRGRQSAWFYTQTVELEEKLRELLLAKLEGRDWFQPLKSFRNLMRRLHHRSFEPYSGCWKICKDGNVCMYRHAVAGIVAGSKETRLSTWREACIKEGPGKVWEICRDQTYQLIESNHAHREAMKRIGLCYAQHMLADSFAEDHKELLQELLDEASKNGDKDERLT